jgi:hypothetical protein
VFDKNDEKSDYYKSALNLVFGLWKQPAYVSLGRWSYAPGANNPLIFSLGGVGGFDETLATGLDHEFGTTRFRRALKEFSFTKLLSETDQEVWFHFTNENPPEKGDDQAYLGAAATSKRPPLIEVAAAEVSDALVGRIINLLEQTNVTEYEGVPLEEKRQAIALTLDAAIFSIFTRFQPHVRHVSFMPITVPSVRKNVVGILSINSQDHFKVSQIEPILQPVAEGLMAPFHLKEIDDQRHQFSLRSAIAAIMSRNMSHNIGSHVLWHLSQQLKDD